MGQNVNITNIRTKLIRINPALTVSALTTGQVLWVPTEVKLAGGLAGDIVRVESVRVVDNDDVGPDLDLMFFSENPASHAALDATFSLSDADSLLWWGKAELRTWVDAANNFVAFMGAGDYLDDIRPKVDANGSIWCSGVIRATNTATASGMVVDLGIVREKSK